MGRRLGAHAHVVHRPPGRLHPDHRIDGCGVERDAAARPGGRLAGGHRHGGPQARPPLADRDRRRAVRPLRPVHRPARTTRPRPPTDPNPNRPAPRGTNRRRRDRQTPQPGHRRRGRSTLTRRTGTRQVVAPPPTAAQNAP